MPKLSKPVFLVLLFLVACGGVQRQSASSRNVETDVAAAASRAKRVDDLRMAVANLITIEPSVKVVENEIGLFDRRFMKPLHEQLDKVIAGCDTGGRPQKRTPLQRSWCSQQVIELCEKMAQVAPIVIENSFRLKAVYEEWFRAAQPLMELLTEEHRDRMRTALSPEHKQRMALELQRLVMAARISSVDSPLRADDWESILTAFGDIYRSRGEFISEITPEWRTFNNAAASAFCPLLESRLVIRPLVDEIHGL